MSKKIVVKETYQDGQYIIKEGSYGEGTYVVLSGKVQISKISDNKKVVVATLEKGDIFGEMSFIDKKPRSASAISIGESQVGLFDKEYLDYEINKAAQEFRTIIHAITERLRQTSIELVSLKAEHHKLLTEMKKR